MNRVVLVLAVFTLAGCRCDGGNISARYGELVFVQGAELVKDGAFSPPPVFMGTEGQSEVPVRNLGLENVRIATVTRDEGDEGLSLDGAVGLEVDGDADATLPLVFRAPQAADASLQETVHTARFTLTLEGTAAGNEVLTLTVTATATARDCYVPPLVEFGRVPLAHAVIKPLQLVNGASLPATSTFSSVTGADASAFFIDGSSPLEVAANGTASLPLRFSPLEARDYEASFTLQRGALCPQGTVVLRGTGDDASLAWTPDRLTFGRLPLGESTTQAVTFTNQSNADLSLDVVLASTEFLVEPGAPTVLPAHGSAVVQVTCKPTQFGPLTAELTVNLGTVPVTPARIPLTCTGGGPRIRAQPNPFTFGAVPYSTTGAAVTKRRLIVQNVGTAPPSQGDTSNNLFLGRNGSLPWFAVAPTNATTRASEFSVGLITPYDATKGVPAIAGQNFLEFEVTLTPLSAGDRRADLLIYSNDSKEPVLRVPMTAFPRLPEDCTITVTPDRADFGGAPRGATLVRTFQVKNTSRTAGNQCLISGIEMAPGSDLAFTVTAPATAALVIPAGATQNIVVSATVPGDANFGAYLRGVLRFTVGNNGDSRELPVDLQVSRCLLVDPPLLDFGLVQENCTSASRAVTLYNTCGVPLTVSPVSTAPAPFRITSSPFATGPLTLQPAESATLLLAAAPTASGSYADTLVFNTVESGETAQEAVALRATADPVGFQQDSFTQGASAVDILFVIDDSCSMADEQAALASNFAAFISAATQGATSDWRIGVTTTDLFGQQGVLRAGGPTVPTVLTPTTPNVASAFAQNVQVGVTGSGLEQPFAAMNAAITEPNLSTRNAGFIRTDAALAVIIVTDAVEQSQGTPASYVSTLRALKNNLTELVNVSVVGPFTASGGTCSVEGVDNGRYSAIVSLTNGAQADICTSSWAMDLENVSRSVFGRRRTFSLTGTPRSTADTTVTVNGMQQSSGWRFDATTNSIVFTTPPDANAAITVGYRTACF